MKVLMTTMMMDIGGAETHVLEVSRELVRRGYDVTVASAGGVYVDKLRQAGVRHITAPLNTRNPLHMLRAYKILARLLKKEKFDLIHAHARIPAYLCSLLSKRYHVRMVTTAHCTFKVNGILRRLTRWGERSLAVSEDIKQYLIDEYAVYSGNIGVTINGINMETFSADTDPGAVKKELGLAHGVPRIVHVSRIDSDRSLTALLLASAGAELAARCPGLEILIVGSGDDFAKLQELAEKANAAAGRRVVILTGARTDIGPLIATGDVFVGVSRAALEAMAMRKPTVLSGNEGYCGIYDSDKFEQCRETNFCCRGSALPSAEVLVRDLCELLNMEASARDALGERCEEMVRECYSVGTMTDDYERMYKKMEPYEYYRYGDILLIGYYGFSNTGDDSLLRLIAQALRREEPHARITAMTHSPHASQTVYGVRCISRRNPFVILRAMKHAKMLIAGGGNLLQDKTSCRSVLYYTAILRLAKRMGLKTMIWANGVGPLMYETSVQRVKRCLDGVDLITLREPESERLVKKLKIAPEKVRLTADPSFLAELPEKDWLVHLKKHYHIEENHRYFAVSLRAWQTDFAANARAFASVCDRVARQYDLVPVFIPMQEDRDNGVTQRVRALMETDSLLIRGASGEELLGLLADMEFVVSMRLHTLIFGAAAGIPVFGVSYDKKLDAFLSYIGMAPALPQEVVGSEELYFSAATRAMMCAQDLRGTISASRSMLIGLAAEDAKVAIALYHEKM